MQNEKILWCFILHVNADTDLDEAWPLLQNAGLNPLYIEEEPEILPKIYIEDNSNYTEEKLLDQFAFIEYIDRKEMEGIDWEALWKAHGFNYSEGYVHINLPNAISTEWKDIKLTPGVGFGDLSHPTTRLIIQMMKGDVNNQYVVDVGSGSGVLALCAVAQGAKHVYAIDIDETTLKHSEENAALNGMADKISFFLPETFSVPPSVKSCVILMNMVMNEQQEAWNSLKPIHNTSGISFTSGILEDHKQAYMDWIQSLGWKLVEKQEEEGWLGFKFVR